MRWECEEVVDVVAKIDGRENAKRCVETLGAGLAHQPRKSRSLVD